MSSYKLKVKLKGCEPPVTRTIKVPKNITFYELHRILRISMGWRKKCLHGFRIPKYDLEIGENEESLLGGRRLNEKTILVSEYERCRIVYTYDYLNDWIHEITFLKDIDDGEDDVPEVLKYEGDCPLENCGGLEGHMEIMETVSDSSNPDYDRIKAKYDMYHKDYDLDEVNRKLMGLKLLGIPQNVMSIDTLDMIGDAIVSESSADLYYDPLNRTVVEHGPHDEIGEDEILIRKGDAPAIFDLANEFLEMNPKLRKRLGAGTMDRKRLEKMKDLLKKDQKLTNSWKMFLNDKAVEYSDIWADKNGFVSEEEYGDGYEDYDDEYEDYDDGSDTPGDWMNSIRIFDDRKNPLEQFRDSFMCYSDLLNIGREKIPCPHCGNICKARINMDGIPNPVRGAMAYPATFKCPRCKKYTELRKLNDGYITGYHYVNARHPYKSMAHCIELEAAARKENNPLKKAGILLDTALEYRMNEGMKKAGDLLDEAVGLTDDENIRCSSDIIRKYFSGTPVDRDEVERLEDRSRYKVLGYAICKCEDEEEAASCFEKTQKALDSCSLPEWLIGHMRIISAYFLSDTIKGEEGLEHLFDALKAVTESLLKRPKKAISAEYRNVCNAFEECMWFCAENDMLEKAGPIIDYMYSNFCECDKLKAESIRAVTFYKKGLYEMSVKKDKEAAERMFEEVIRINTSKRDSGPVTNPRVVASSLLLYYLDESNENRLDMAVDLTMMMVENGLIDGELLDDIFNEALVPILLVKKGYGGMKEYVENIKHLRIDGTISEESVKGITFDEKAVWEISAFNLTY